MDVSWRDFPKTIEVTISEAYETVGEEFAVARRARAKGRAEALKVAAREEAQRKRDRAKAEMRAVRGRVR